MKRILSLGLIVATIVLAAVGVLTLYDELLEVGRMWETPAIKPHENPIPVMASGSVPFHGGEQFFRSAVAEEIQPPFPLTESTVVAAGKTTYQRYCIQCHGPHFDGKGTVGQSFAPLPGDLRSEKVQSMVEGSLFKEISYGLPEGRQPALATTIAVNDRWNVIAFVRSLGVRE